MYGNLDTHTDFALAQQKVACFKSDLCGFHTSQTIDKIDSFVCKIFMKFHANAP